MLRSVNEVTGLPPELGLLALSIYVCIVIGIGLWEWYFKKSAKDIKTYLVAGATMNPWLVIMATLCNFVFAGSVLAVSEAGFTFGFHGYWAYAIAAMFSWGLSGAIASLLRSRAPRAVTLTEYLYERFRGSKLAHLPIAICSILFILALTIFQLWGGILALSTLIPAVPYEIIGVIVVVSTLIYTALGGMRALIITSFFEFTVMVIGALALALYGTWASGGPVELYRKIVMIDPALMNLSRMSEELPRSLVLLAFGAWIPAGFILSFNYQNWNTVAYGREVHVCGLSTIYWYLFIFFTWIVGLTGLTLFKRGEIYASAVYPLTAMKLLGNVGGIIALLVVIAAFWTTSKGFLFGSATTITQDIYRKHINPKASESRCIYITRILCVVIAVIMYVAAMLLRGLSILWMQVLFVSVSAAAFGPLMLALFWERLNEAGIFSGTVVSLVFWFVCIFGGLLDWGTTSITTLILGFVVTIVVSLLPPFAKKRYPIISERNPIIVKPRSRLTRQVSFVIYWLIFFVVILVTHFFGYWFPMPISEGAFVAIYYTMLGAVLAFTVVAYYFASTRPLREYER